MSGTSPTLTHQDQETTQPLESYRGAAQFITQGGGNKSQGIMMGWRGLQWPLKGPASKKEENNYPTNSVNIKCIISLNLVLCYK